MKKMSFKRSKRTSAGKLITGLLLGGAVGAVVSWLRSPAHALEMWRRLRGDVMDARDRAKTAEGNIESHARELAHEVSNTAGSGETPAMGRPQTMGVQG